MQLLLDVSWTNPFFLTHSVNSDQLVALPSSKHWESASWLNGGTVFPSELASGIIGDGVFPKDKIPLERSGTEEDMAGAILFLTSQAGAYSTGSVLILDGGRLSIMPSTY
jgi:NAD(P)-dependent dehydrogenase (short-subunit alcohol dehydrogenase family)